MAKRTNKVPSKTWQRRNPDGTMPPPPQPTFRSIYRRDARAFR
jgi:hypothetical protein